MCCRHHSATALVAIVAGVIASTDAQAASRVGGTTSVVRDVSGSSSGQSWAKKVEGDDVYENEFIRTLAESSTRISFIDETDIRIGPTATMKIDRVVFKTNRSVEELIVSAETGAMRWNSGTSPSGAYQVKTPDAIIRPLGTAFDLLVDSQRTIVVLRRGQIEVCSIVAPQRCQTLSRPGDMIIATPNDLERPQRAGPGPSEFADRCLSAGNTTPCAIMASVKPTSPPPTTTGSATPTRSVEPVVPNEPIVVVVPPNGPRPPVPPVNPPGCHRDQAGRLKCGPDRIAEPPVPPANPSNCHRQGRLKCQPMPSRPADSARRPGDSTLAYVPKQRVDVPKQTSVRPTYVRPTNVRPIVRPTNVRPTVTHSYVRPIVRPTFVRPTSPRPTPIR